MDEKFVFIGEADFIYLTSGMTTTVYNLRDSKLGIDGEFLEVFISRKVTKNLALPKK